MSKKGFTLVELLIAITIVAILTAIFIGFGTMTTMKKGRDAKLRADIKNAQKAYEQYYSINGKYGTWAEMDTALQKPLSDKVTRTAGGGGYCLCAPLEVKGLGNAGGLVCTFIENGDYYCVASVQEDFAP